MTVTDTPTREATADLLDKAASAIHTNGWCKRYLYDTRQAEGGTPLSACRVDIIGALNLAATGSPRYPGNPLTRAAEQAINARIKAPSVVAWCDQPGNSGQQAITLLRDTATSLRGEAAA